MMNNLDLNSYYALKRKEVDFLNSFLVSKQLPKFNTLQNFVSIKEKIRNCLLSEFYKNNYYSFPTNKNEKRYRINNLSYNYNYQRFDINIKFDNFFDKLYDLGHLPHLYIFTNSGMCSIYSTMSALNLTGKFSIEFNDDIYFETYKLITQKNFNNICRFKKISLSSRILLLDTISIKDTIKNLRQKNINKYFAIIIDTTCYFMEELKTIINYIIDTGVICILLRSHTKLDMLSTEYSRLGSILYIFPQELTNRDYNTIIKIIDNTYRILPACGGYAYPESIPPFWNSEDFFTLNKARISRIKQNSITIRNILKNNLKNAVIVLPDHQVFVLVRLHEKYSKDEIKKKIYFITKDKRFSKIPISYAGGFGFDFIALDTYVDMTCNENVIRISAPDYSNKLIEYISYTLLDILNDIF